MIKKLLLSTFALAATIGTTFATDPSLAASIETGLLSTKADAQTILIGAGLPIFLLFIGWRMFTKAGSKAVKG